MNYVLISHFLTSPFFKANNNESHQLELLNVSLTDVPVSLFSTRSSCTCNCRGIILRRSTTRSNHLRSWTERELRQWIIIIGTNERWVLLVDQMWGETHQSFFLSLSFLVLRTSQPPVGLTFPLRFVERKELWKEGVKKRGLEILWNVEREKELTV